jgi:hypothetical protein
MFRLGRVPRSGVRVFVDDAEQRMWPARVSNVCRPRLTDTVSGRLRCVIAVSSLCQRLHGTGDVIWLFLSRSTAQLPLQVSLQRTRMHRVLRI